MKFKSLMLKNNVGLRVQAPGPSKLHVTQVKFLEIAINSSFKSWTSSDSKTANRLAYVSENRSVINRHVKRVGEMAFNAPYLLKYSFRVYSPDFCGKIYYSRWAVSTHFCGTLFLVSATL